jgi:hypothetical protein
MSMVSIEPGYIALYHAGELERRANALEDRLASCDICPRECHVDRLEDEPGLVKRFGDEYLRYRNNVPRWMPRLSPWKNNSSGEEG